MRIKIDFDEYIDMTKSDTFIEKMKKDLDKLSKSSDRKGKLKAKFEILYNGKEISDEQYTKKQVKAIHKKCDEYRVKFTNCKMDVDSLLRDLLNYVVGNNIYFKSTMHTLLQKIQPGKKCSEYMVGYIKGNNIYMNCLDVQIPIRIKSEILQFIYYPDGNEYYYECREILGLSEVNFYPDYLDSLDELLQQADNAKFITNLRYIMYWKYGYDSSDADRADQFIYRLEDSKLTFAQKSVVLHLEVEFKKIHVGKLGWILSGFKEGIKNELINEYKQGNRQTVFNLLNQLTQFQKEYFHEEVKKYILQEMYHKIAEFQSISAHLNTLSRYGIELDMKSYMSVQGYNRCYDTIIDALNVIGYNIEKQENNVPFDMNLVDKCFTLRKLVEKNATFRENSKSYVINYESKKEIYYEINKLMNTLFPDKNILGNLFILPEEEKIEEKIIINDEYVKEEDLDKNVKKMSKIKIFLIITVLIVIFIIVSAFILFVQIWVITAIYFAVKTKKYKKSAVWPFYFRELRSN